MITGLTWAIAAVAGLIAWRVTVRLRLAGHPDRLFARSLVFPAAGIALLLPITLHLPIVLALYGRAAFDNWVWLSMWITALPHAVLVSTSVRRGYQLVAGKPASSPRKIYKVTVIASCLPFVVIFAIPPVLVALTALPLLPLLRAMERIVTREREELAGAPHGLPRASARFGRRAG
jgi:heme exporter protein D